MNITLTDDEVRMLTHRASDAGYSLEGWAEALVVSDQRPVEEMCYVLFEGVPQVFYGEGGFKVAEEQAHHLASESCAVVTLMAVPKIAVEHGLAAKYVGTVGLPLQDAMKMAESD